MKIAVDLDEVMYEWLRTACYLLREERGTPIRADQIVTWRFSHQLGDGDYDWLWSEGVRLGLFRHGHVVKHAVRGVRALTRAGHDMVVVTHRPRSAVKDTLAWLDFHFGGEDPYPFTGVHILSDGEPKTTVEFDLLIDDKPENILDSLGHAREGLLYDRPWNQETSFNGRRVKDWYEIVERLT